MLGGHGGSQRREKGWRNGFASLVAAEMNAGCRTHNWDSWPTRQAGPSHSAKAVRRNAVVGEREWSGRR